MVFAWFPPLTKEKFDTTGWHVCKKTIQFLAPRTGPEIRQVETYDASSACSKPFEFLDPEIRPETHPLLTIWCIFLFLCPRHTSFKYKMQSSRMPPFPLTMELVSSLHRFYFASVMHPHLKILKRRIRRPCNSSKENRHHAASVVLQRLAHKRAAIHP